MLLVYGGLLYADVRPFSDTPTGFIPSQDKGYLLVNVRLPDSASLDRTTEVMQQIEEIADDGPASSHTVAIAGQSMLLGANAANFGTMYVMLDDFHTAGRRRTSRPTRSRPSSSGLFDAKSGRRRSTSSAPRRSTAWERPAASRSSSKTAATWA